MSLTKLYSVTDDHGDTIEVIESAGLVDVTVEEDGDTSCVILTVEQAEDLIEALELAIQDALVDELDDEGDESYLPDPIFDEAQTFTVNVYNPTPAESDDTRNRALQPLAMFVD